MRILYLGPTSGTSQHRINAMRRLGYDINVIDPEEFIPSHPFLYKIHWETGGLLTDDLVLRKLETRIGGTHYDYAWVDNGRYVSPKVVRRLRRQSRAVISLNVDDPFGKRDRFSWAQYLRAVPEYDLLVVVREENFSEAYARGAKQVLRVYRTADEVAHAPRLVTDEHLRKWGSEVSFVGTWFPERGPFMVELIERGVPLSIFGNRWGRSPEWKTLQSVWRGPGTTNDDDYAAAILCSKISLGLLSKGNRDLHTQRSLEIPSMGGVFCAERTAEHEALYVDGEEVVLWSSAAECAAKCLHLLKDDPSRQRIAKQGRTRALQNGHFNERMISRVLDVCFAEKAMSSVK